MTDGLEEGLSSSELSVFEALTLRQLEVSVTDDKGTSSTPINLLLWALLLVLLVGLKTRL